ncbi:substrate-specific activator of APC-dependent proteolysis, variant 2 [Perkinsus olseni]|uniref:Substrate-specific activator of APC-dependent proteolysis, variant 2 n=1 Tax=Perkinsus olseni TaxID=32597 RepID=A0A7J6PKI1_PEROL|nr:substrate-specific activator of APC-dependent proteolysis, variant 2 [Perkinsus olseni]
MLRLAWSDVPGRHSYEEGYMVLNPESGSVDMKALLSLHRPEHHLPILAQGHHDSSKPHGDAVPKGSADPQLPLRPAERSLTSLCAHAYSPRRKPSIHRFLWRISILNPEEVGRADAPHRYVGGLSHVAPDTDLYRSELGLSSGADGKYLMVEDRASGSPARPWPHFHDSPKPLLHVNQRTLCPAELSCSVLRLCGEARMCRQKVLAFVCKSTFAFLGELSRNGAFWRRDSTRQSVGHSAADAQNMRAEASRESYMQALCSELLDFDLSPDMPGNSEDASSLTPTARSIVYNQDGSPQSHGTSLGRPRLFGNLGKDRSKDSSEEEFLNEARELHPVPHSTRKSLTYAEPLRKISRSPAKVLDAPNLQDDFYLNLVDWGAGNVLAVGLAKTVYLWCPMTGAVTQLCEVPEDDLVASVAWNQDGSSLAIGTGKGDVQIWDPVRVCGLSWSYNGAMLASGGNDNKVLTWSASMMPSGNVTDGHSSRISPVLRLADHQAAVKALAWSPHQHHTLATGGGTADRCIRFWDTHTGTCLNCVDTGSQVCNLSWAKSVNEVVSTHGYSLNQVVVWKYPSMRKVVTLTGHTYRVLYLSVSPDGQTVVTGAGDETLRFWNVFPPIQGIRSTASFVTVNLKKEQFGRGNFVATNPGRIDDYYLIEAQPIGKGSGGSVQRATNRGTGAVRAVKTIPKRTVKSIQRLADEIEVAARLVRQMISPVYYMHSRGVVHRDLKPENFMFSNPRDVTEASLKIIDFGVSKRIAPGQVLRTRACTPYYVAPEVLSSKYTNTCDMWSIGVIAYILLCGSPPFYGENEMEVLDPSRRLTAEQALHHPWIDSLAPGASVKTISPGALVNLNNFNKQNKLKRMALTVIARQIPEDSIEELRQMFSALDKNGDGTLTVEEISKGFELVGMDVPDHFSEYVANIDVGGSGVVDYSKFLAATLDKKHYIQEAVCWAAFRAFDLDGNGKITKEELAQVLSGGAFENIGDALGIHSREIEAIIDEVDADGDGEIDFEEFMQMMRVRSGNGASTA